MFLDTAVPASAGRLYEPKFLSVLSPFHSSTVCLVSLRKSCCSQAAVLRDLPRDLVGLGAESNPPSWGTLCQDRLRLQFHPQLLLLVCIRKDLHGRLAALCPGEGLPVSLEDHAGWANHVLYHCALESPLEGHPWGRGESSSWTCLRFPWDGQPFWALLQDPPPCSYFLSVSISSELFVPSCQSVIINHSQQASPGCGLPNPSWGTMMQRGKGT